MNPQIPEKSLLEAYLSLLEKRLPGFVTGFYLHGSIALGAFDPHFSDIDFIAVISRRSAASDIDALTALHRELRQKFPRETLSGIYLQERDLGQFEDAIEPHPHYQEGVLHPRGQHDINSVTWWLLKNRGVALLGTEPQTLNFSVDWDKLVTDMHENLNSYWARYTRQPGRIVWLLSDYGIQWAILGVLRQYYTFNEQGITSKIGAGEYALKKLPEKWHRIIQEALNIRNQKQPSLYRFRIVRAVEARRFLRFVIRVCNAYLDTKFDIPENLPPGDVDITIEIPNLDEQFTEEEIKELLTFTPRSGAEVVAAGLVGGWEHKGITDPVAWVEELRRKQREKRKW